MAWLSVLATTAAVLVATGGSPAQAVQATGDDVPTWAPGWSWTYGTTFNYTADGTNVTINETNTYAFAGIETFQGQRAYKLNLTGTITGGSGTAAVDGVGNATLSNFSGTVSGSRYMRVSDLALLQENQHQDLKAKAQVSIISANITAVIDLQMTPQRGWRTIAFPHEAGTSWINDVDVDYTGGFSYDAGSLGGTGASTFDGTFMLDGPTTVTNETIAVPAGSIPTKKAFAQSTDGQTQATMWYSNNHKNAGRLLMQVPLDGGSLTLDQKLASASIAAPATSLTNTITPSLTCAGGDITVAGKLSSGAAGVPVQISLDKSPVTPGAAATASTTTTAGGNYSATLQAPGESDGYQRSGVRGTWGVVATAAGANGVATVVVTPKDCTAITNNGDTSAPQGTNASVSAVLVDKTGASMAGKTVTFALSGGGSVTATANGSGVATATLAIAGPPRAATLTASYAGDSSHEPASVATAFTVGAIVTTTSVVANQSTVTIGAPVRFTATVTPTHGANAGGTVQFKVDGSDFGAAVPLTNGSAESAAISTLGLGNHTVTAVYNGTSDHLGSTSPTVTFRVREPLRPTSTSLTTSASTAVYGQSVTLSATVTTATGTPTGEVIFTAGGTTIATVPLAGDGTASVDATNLPVGSNQVVASYNGDDVYDASSSSPKNVSVSKADVSVELTASDDSTLTGEAVSFTATVGAVAPGGGTPAGSVDLAVDGTVVASATLVNGTAMFDPVSSFGAGTHSVTATYGGSASHNAGSDSDDQTVAAADTVTTVVATPSPSMEQQEVSFRAVVAAVAPGSGYASGTVTFHANGTSIGSAPLSGGEAILQVDDLAPGTYTVTASYGGDSNYNGSESESISHSVLEGTAVVETTTALTSSSNPSTYGELITFTASVSAVDESNPQGTVQFSVDGSDFGDPVAVVDGVAESAALASPDPGDHTVIAAFTPAVGWAGSGDILVQTVAAAGVDVELTSSNPDAEVGQDVSFTATVSSQVAGTGTPTGYAQFSVDGLPFGDAVPIDGDGSATSPVVHGLGAGNHAIGVLYSGDVHFAAGSDSVDQAVGLIATSTTLATSSSSITYGGSVTLTATVAPANASQGSPAGTVTFLDGSTVVATAVLSAGAGSTGVATATVPGLTAGSHTLKAVYAGSATHEASTSATKSVTVAKRATVTSAAAAVVGLNPLGLPLGQLRASVTAGGQPLAGVPVEFKIGTKVQCTSTTDANGVATCNALSAVLALTLNLGYTATFAGDANHLSSTARAGIIK